MGKRIAGALLAAGLLIGGSATAANAGFPDDPTLEDQAGHCVKRGGHVIRTNNGPVACLLPDGTIYHFRGL